jgi:hypothetical protein
MSSWKWYCTSLVRLRLAGLDLLFARLGVLVRVVVVAQGQLKKAFLWFIARVRTHHGLDLFHHAGLSEERVDRLARDFQKGRLGLPGGWHMR